MDFQLKTLFLDSTFEVDYSAVGRAGAAVVVFPHLKVLDQGSRGDGTFAWATIETKTGPVSIGSIYAPNKRALCIELWEWLLNFTHTSNWLLLGDWNIVEFHDDSVGHSLGCMGWKNVAEKN